MVNSIIGSIFLAIVLVLLIIILVLCIITKEWKGVFVASIYLIMFTILEISTISDIQDTPTAIDVYRGLTELEITTVNGVPTDTIVVFKNK